MEKINYMNRIIFNRYTLIFLIILIPLALLPISYGYPLYFELVTLLKSTFIAILIFCIILILREFKVCSFNRIAFEPLIITGICLYIYTYIFPPSDNIGYMNQEAFIDVDKGIIHVPKDYEYDENLTCQSDRYKLNNPALFPILRISRNLKMGYIDKTGKIIIKPKYAYADDFYEGLARVNYGGYLFDEAWIYSRDLYDNFDIIYGKYGYIDNKGKIIIKLIYDDAGRFSEGLAAVKVKDKYGYINKAGKMVIQPQFYCAGEFENDQAPVCMDKTDKHTLIDRTGKFIPKHPLYDRIHKYSEGLAVVERYGKMGAINTKGQLVIDTVYDFLSPFKESLASVKIGKKYGYINKKGEIVIYPRFTSACNFSEGLANVDEYGEKKKRFINGKGDMVEDYLFEKWGYINKAGNYVITPKYMRGYAFINGIAPIHIDGKWGYINKSGKVLDMDNDDVIR